MQPNTLKCVEHLLSTKYLTAVDSLGLLLHPTSSLSYSSSFLLYSPPPSSPPPSSPPLTGTVREVRVSLFGKMRLGQKSALNLIWSERARILAMWEEEQKEKEETIRQANESEEEKVEDEKEWDKCVKCSLSLEPPYAYTSEGT
jgi:hypothetical protein